METTTTRALTRSNHPFDIPAITVCTLAAIGAALLALAHALDARIGRDTHRAADAERPRARVGPTTRTFAEHGVTDARRIR